MVYGNALNSYQKAQVSGEISPNQLILMLYEGAIKRVNLAKEGVRQNNPKLRGENIGKAIAIVSELHASLDKNIQTEEINFLRSLYLTMMTELAKVSVTNDITTLDRASKYLIELKHIWETTVMNKPLESSQDNEGTRTQKNNKRTMPGYGSPGYAQGQVRTSIAI